MNGMTHRQAIQLIHRRLDGLLKGNQEELLEEHLHSCDSCRAYSEEMALFAANLNQEFKARWDEDPGPSKELGQQVVAKAKGIPMKNRYSSGFRLLGSVAVLVILGLVINFLVSELERNSSSSTSTKLVNSSSQAENRLLAFASFQGGNSDIYTMHADGSGLTNLTNNPAYDGFPHWSPDGKQIAFESDRDGSNQIYLMNADGSNVIQLTHGGDANGFLGGNIQSPWSPDGTKLIFSQNTIDDEKHQFYVLDIATKNTIPLTKEADKFYSPIWSPDGEHIAFILDETQGNHPILRRLYVVDSQGNHLTNLTEGLSEYETVSFADYYWSPLGTSITFVTDSQKGTYKSTVYEANLDSARVQVTQTHKQILDWWNGTALQNDLFQKVEEGSWSILRADGSRSPLTTCKSYDWNQIYYALKRSSNGNLAYGINCSPTGWMLYGINQDGTVINELLSSTLDGKYESLSQMTWSPDDHFLAFVAQDTDDLGPADLYILNVKDPSAQPLKMEYSSSPSWQPEVNENLVKEKSPAKLAIDPQGCKPAEGDSVPSELYGLDVIQNTSLTDGDFTYDFWLYCDPALKPDDQEHLSAIAGLGIYSSWRYTGPQVDGPVQYYYAFDPNNVFGQSGSDGPLYKASAASKSGIDLSETKIMDNIQQGLPVQFHVFVDSSLGQDGAVLSFDLEPTAQGYKITNLEAQKLNDSNQGLLAFTATGEGGNLDIYTVHPDGSGLTNLTNDAAMESNIAWSPDGTKLAFVSDRDGNDNIFVMNADGTNQIRITDDPASDLSPLWSPDGQRIAYTLNDLDKKISNLFVVDSNGENRRRLTDHDKSPDMMGVWAEEWSSDGNYIFFLDQALISKVNTQNGEITKVSPEADWPAYLLAKDGSRIRFLSPCGQDSGEFCSKVKAIGEDGAGEETYETMQLQQVCTSGEPGLHYSQMKWSPDLTKIMVVFNCSKDGGLFYIANADGSDFKPLTSYPIPISAIGFNNYVSFDWSPDSQAIIFTSSPDDPQTQKLSILSVKEALKNPELRSTQLSLSTSQASNLAWQPVATKPLVKEDPTPKPAETVSASELIAFTAIDKNGNTDIFTVHPDGSGLVNLTNNPTLEANLAWSPDGTRLAFVSDQNINVMNADGSDLKSLTDVPGTYAGLLWSPDGTKIAYTLRDSDGKTANIYVLDSNGGNPSRLTDRHPGPDNIWVWAEAWSPDGQYIYYSDYLAPGQAHIIKLNAESGETTVITGKMFDLPSSIVINKDGSIVYLVNCTENAADFCLKVKSINQDGTGDETHETMQIQQPCSSKVGVSSFYFGAKWSPDRTKIIFAIECPVSGVHIYTANADGSDLKPVTGSDPFPYKDIRFDWSPDNQSVAFMQGPDPSKTGLSLWVIRNVDLNPDFQPTWLDLDPAQISELAWQPALISKTVEITPTPGPAQTSSADGLFAFTSEQTGNQDIYTMRADGSQLTNLTNNPASDYGPLWSPDGRKIAFNSERTGNPDIFVMDSDGGNLTQLTDSPGYDGIYTWSPDGGKIIYEVGKEDINKDGQLVLMNSDGSNKTALTEPGSYLFLGWSPDGQKIVYLQQNTETYNPQDDMVVVMNMDGTDRHEWNFIVDRIKWEDDQHFIGDGWNGQVESSDWGWTLTRFSANGDPPVEIASHSNPIVEILNDTHVVGGGSILAWYKSDGNPAPFTSWNSAELCRGDGNQFSPSNWPSTAPDESKALLIIHCQSGKAWFYINPLDGSPIRRLTDFSIDGNKGGGPVWSWSHDGKYGIMEIGNPDDEQASDLYLFDIEQMLKDPSVQPIRLTSDKAMKYGVVWQPVP